MDACVNNVAEATRAPAIVTRVSKIADGNIAPPATL
jgi:hypothetical protein